MQAQKVRHFSTFPLFHFGHLHFPISRSGKFYYYIIYNNNYNININLYQKSCLLTLRQIDSHQNFKNDISKT